MITLNTPGARTLADATQWFVDGHGVYVTISGDTAQLHLRGRIVADRPAAEINSTIDAQDWAVAYLAAEVEMAEQAQAEAEAHMVAEMYRTETVVRVQARGAELLAEADAISASTEPVTIPRMRNGRQAAALRDAGARLAAWTNETEAAYQNYLQDGLADTNGWFAPEAREAWSVVGH